MVIQKEKKLYSMKTKLLLTLFSLLICCTSSAQQRDDFPILAYWGVNPRFATDAHFKAFADCGFNISHYNYASAEQFIQVAKVANKYGVKLLLQSNALSFDTENTVKKVMNVPNLFAYHIYDEPPMDGLEELSTKFVEKIAKWDKNHPCYINLLPYYDDNMLKKTVKASSYSEYVRKAAKVRTPQISFDFYPIMTDGIRSTWFENLETFHKVSQETNKPFWGFVLSVPHAKYPMPTLPMLRLQVYSNLAYGAKGIQYFTYWTPLSSDYDFHSAPVTSDGKFTSTYTVVKKMNTELKSISSLFKDGTITSVNHLGQIPRSTRALSDAPLNIKKLSVKGGQGAIVSQLLYKGKHYLILVNKDYKTKVNVNIQAHTSSVVNIDKKLQPHKLSSQYSISGGDILMFRLD